MGFYQNGQQPLGLVKSFVHFGLLVYVVDSPPFQPLVWICSVFYRRVTGELDSSMFVQIFSGHYFLFGLGLRSQTSPFYDPWNLLLQ